MAVFSYVHENFSVDFKSGKKCAGSFFYVFYLRKDARFDWASYLEKHKVWRAIDRRFQRFRPHYSKLHHVKITSVSWTEKKKDSECNSCGVALRWSSPSWRDIYNEWRHRLHRCAAADTIFASATDVLIKCLLFTSVVEKVLGLAGCARVGGLS